MSDLSPKEVAAAMGLSRSAVYRLIEDGELRAYKVRGRLRVEPAEVRALRERNRVSPRRRPHPPIYQPLPFASPAPDGRFTSELRATKGTT
jgi:excisionase family DNA binding protein